MSQQTINIGTVANDPGADPLRTAFTKINANFTELYNSVAQITSGIGGTAGQIPFSNDSSALAVSAGLIFDATNKALTLGGATVTANKPVITGLQTWNASGTTFYGFDFQIDDQASAAASKVFRYRGLSGGGTELLSLSKVGVLAGAYGVDSWTIKNLGSYATEIKSAYDLLLSSTGGAVQVSSTGANVSPGYMLLRTTGLLFGRDAGNASISFSAGLDTSASGSITIAGQSAYASAVTNITGGAASLTGGAGASGSAGNAHGGNLTLGGGTGYGTGRHGRLILQNLPTSSSGLTSGMVWSNGGVLTIV